MQFMPDGKLHAVFVREAKPAAPTQPFVGRVMPVEPPRVVALSYRRVKPDDARKITAPIHDPVMATVLERSQAAYNQRLALGTAMLKQASQAFTAHIKEES